MLVTSQCSAVRATSNGSKPIGDRLQAAALQFLKCQQVTTTWSCRHIANASQNILMRVSTRPRAENQLVQYRRPMSALDHWRTCATQYPMSVLGQKRTHTVRSANTGIGLCWA